MSKVLIIGCGGVASVAIHKCCQVPEVFTEICIASRTKAKCDKLAAELAPKTTTKITTAQVDADHVDEVIALIKSYQPDLVMNIALPYQDLTIMDACLACGVNYMDTANYEPENTDDPEWRAIYEKRCKEAGFSAYFDYSWQWAYAKKFEEAGLTALLGSGFDPGVTQAYCAYAKKHEFDTIDTIDILDCNGGDHGYAFATNFNPEINLREVSAPGSYWENGHWVEIPAMSIKREYNFDQVGQKDMYLLHHEEIESLAKNIPEAKRIRFFMTFGQSYLDHMRCLEDVGMLSTTPVNFNGQEIVLADALAESNGMEISDECYFSFGSFADYTADPNCFTLLSVNDTKFAKQPPAPGPDSSTSSSSSSGEETSSSENSSQGGSSAPRGGCNGCGSIMTGGIAGIAAVGAAVSMILTGKKRKKD